MSKVLRMTFSLSDSKTVSFSLADPKDGLTKAEVEAAMDDMLTKQAVIVDGVQPSAIKGAVIKNTEEIALA